MTVIIKIVDPSTLCNIVGTAGNGSEDHVVTMFSVKVSAARIVSGWTSSLQKRGEGVKLSHNQLGTGPPTARDPSPKWAHVRDLNSYITKAAWPCMTTFLEICTYNLNPSSHHSFLPWRTEAVFSCNTTWCHNLNKHNVIFLTAMNCNFISKYAQLIIF
jgi:hypothetical protein